jgi:hypothetical protein
MINAFQKNKFKQLLSSWYRLGVAMFLMHLSSLELIALMV